MVTQLVNSGKYDTYTRKLIVWDQEQASQMHHLTTVFRRLSATASHDSLMKELSMTAYYEVVMQQTMMSSWTAHDSSNT